MSTTPAHLSIADLAVHYNTRYGTVESLRDATLTLRRGEVLGVVGESGSGKSVMCRTILGLTRREGAEIVSGSVMFAGIDLTSLSEESLARSIRGSKLSMVFQDSTRSLDSLFSVGDQLIETVVAKRHVGKREARGIALDLLKAVAIPDPEKRLRAFPHQLSGGMRQRVAIAIAMAADPEILLADEPTTALDVTVQATILQLLAGLAHTRNCSVVLVTHDLGVVSAICDSVAVMYAGYVVEAGPIEDIFDDPRHPYTRALLELVGPTDAPAPRGLPFIPGQPPSVLGTDEGCPFRWRCPRVEAVCYDAMPARSFTTETRFWRCWNPL